MARSRSSTRRASGGGRGPRDRAPTYRTYRIRVWLPGRLGISEVREFMGRTLAEAKADAVSRGFLLEAPRRTPGQKIRDVLNQGPANAPPLLPPGQSVASNSKQGNIGGGMLGAGAELNRG